MLDPTVDLEGYRATALATLDALLSATTEA